MEFRRRGRFGMKEKTEGARKIWNKYKYAALVALIGAGLLLWPGLGSVEDRGEKPASSPAAQSGWDLQTIQTEMEDILAAMDGVGQVKVMLTVDSDGELSAAGPAMEALGGRLEAASEYEIPGTEVRHRVVIIKKFAQTQKKFPRTFAKIKKNPL